MTTKSPPGHTGTTSSATNANSTTQYQIYIVLLGLILLVYYIVPILQLVASTVLDLLVDLASIYQ